MEKRWDVIFIGFVSIFSLPDDFASCAIVRTLPDDQSLHHDIRTKKNAPKHFIDPLYYRDFHSWLTIFDNFGVIYS